MGFVGVQTVVRESVSGTELGFRVEGLKILRFRV